MLLRLAGMGGKALLGMGAKKGVGAAVGRFGREALADAALVGGAMQLPSAISAGYGLATGDAVKSAQDEILRQGTTDGTYDIDLGNQLKSSISGMLGGKTIDQESLKGRKKDKNKYSLLEGEENALFRKQLQGIGVNPEDIAGSSVSGLKAEYADQIRRKDLQTDTETAIALRALDPSYIDPKETQTYTREQTKQARLDTLTREKQARLDSIDNRESSYMQAMAELDFKKGQSNRDFDYQDRMLDYKMKQSKADRMQKIAMALGGLGSLFAV